MRIRHRLLPLPPLQIRMHHLPDDRPGPDDRDLDDDVVEGRRLEPRQRRHLRARFHLEDPDRVRLLQHPVDRQGRSAGRCARSSGAWESGIGSSGVDDVERILQHRHHAEAEQIDLHDPHVGAVVLVPLDDDAAGHRGVFERDDLVEPALADHHAAGMLAEVPRQVLDLLPQRAEQLDRRIARRPCRHRAGCAPVCRSDRRTRNGS